MSVHDGHRGRIRNRYLREGLTEFDDHQVLEMMLFYTIPRRDTNEIAHALLNEYGSLDRVLLTPARELTRVEGIGDNAATFLNFLGDFYGRCRYTKGFNKIVLRSIDDCGKFFLNRLKGRKNETLAMVSLDANCRVLDWRIVSEGGINYADVPIRRIVDLALAANASSVALAHNHPGGLALPSAEDIQATIMVAKALRTIDVYLVDHFICVEDYFLTTTMTGDYNPEEVYAEM